ncbi:hypothetical protein ACUODJ_52005, partial [Escherichia sp. HC-CC]
GAISEHLQIGIRAIDLLRAEGDRLHSRKLRPTGMISSKIYAKFGVEIYAAAKQGEPDPELNTSLKFVIERAKQAQVPKHVIDKAIDKAKGGGDETFV